MMHIDCPRCGHKIAVSPKLTPTPRAQDALVFIAAYMRTHGAAPCYREIGAAIGVSSKHTVSRLVKQLEDRGHIARGVARCRSLALLGASP